MFDYFTNLALVREAGSKGRAVWFEFDLAAFIAAIKSPHRYFQDTLTREQDAARLKEKIAAMEGRGHTAGVVSYGSQIFTFRVRLPQLSAWLCEPKNTSI